MRREEKERCRKTTLGEMKGSVREHKHEQLPDEFLSSTK